MTLKNMKIISLTAENVKRLVAVSIKPDGNLVQITGKNGQGKTSVLDSIWWCLAGSGTIQSTPIRKGQERARISLDLGEIIVTRTFQRATDGKAAGTEGTFTTKVAVEAADGAAYKSPQALIDGLIDSLAFDPLAFDRMKPKDKFTALAKFVPDIDFEHVERQNDGDFERRAVANRMGKEARAAAGLIYVPDGTPDEPIDETALVQQLQEAGDKNASETQRQGRRDAAAAKVTDLRAAAADLLARIQPDATHRRHECDRELVNIDNQIRQLRLRADELKETCEANIRTSAASLTQRAADTTKEADDLQARIDTAEPIAEPIDTVAIAKQIEEARNTNKAINRAAERARHLSVAARYETEAQTLTENMAARTKAKEAAIAAAKMPIAGIDFGAGVVLLNGVPFEQASDAERLRASVAIAMAANPKLRVIRIRDGSLLDDDAMALLAKMADEHDMQVWIERVDSSGSVGFVLEDGHARKAEETQQEGAAA